MLFRQAIYHKKTYTSPHILIILNINLLLIIISIINSRLSTSFPPRQSAWPFSKAKPHAFWRHNTIRWPDAAEISALPIRREDISSCQTLLTSAMTVTQRQFDRFSAVQYSSRKVRILPSKTAPLSPEGTA